MADFQKNIAEFDLENIQVIAASVDPLENAKKTVNANNITFPVAYGLTAADIAKSHGSFYADDGSFLHATGFVVNPQGKIEIAVYSSSAIGRLTPADVLFMVKYFKNQTN